MIRMKEKMAACMGDNCVDYYDETGEAYFGGNPVNVAVYLSELGVKSAYLGVVGTDDFGKAMTSALAGKGVDISHVQTAEGKTALTHVRLEGQERILGDYEEGVMKTYRLTREDREFICTCDAVITGIWGHCEGELADLRDRGILTVFDCSDRPDDAISLTAVPHTDFLFFSDDRSSDGELKEKLREITALGARIAIATRGEKGSLAYDRTGFISCGAVPCKVVDTIGAGDSFIAGFTAAALKGRPVKECMQAGAVRSSITLGYIGAW